jgi:triacylglycerol lipase
MASPSPGRRSDTAGVRTADQVLLVPGFFGFGSFGREGRPHITYFDHVIKAMVAARPELEGRVHVHEPPPMGSLQARVRSLHDAVLQHLGGALVRGASGGRGPRIHLVGHSIGGVDARLLANPHYRFHGEDRRLRTRLLRHLGTVVALSAPQHGTPIARSFMRGFPRLLLEGMAVATIMANAGRMTQRLGWPGIGLAYTLFEAVRPRRGPFIDFLTGMDEETARQIERFRGMVLSDTRILRDLAPEQMAVLNERLGDHGTRLVEIVTVAPRPSLTRGGLHHLDRRAVYALCYAGTARGDFRPQGFPRGPWIASRPPGTEREAVEDGPRANDGIVPASSQTLGGRAARLVLADHLDVVGHFEWRQNTTLFKSGADFGRRQFEELWRFVAEAL